MLQFEPQAKQASLAYVKAPRISNTESGKKFGEDAAQIVSDMCIEKQCEAIIVEQFKERLSLIIFEKGETNWDKTVNAALLEEGLASIYVRENQEDDLPKEIDSWYNLEENAKEEQMCIWEYGGNASDSD